ncbi:citrate lyase holo-[acyl-carrier protein] synthase [Paenibacillus kribbensis]|uniref:citrate lyase holo-[acyl-carrier protein] synthase n=1 Tax=Paenibacillus kribbensis TaxID=172713 RepID=UPI002DB99148|nr:citrate lyase holo-[acyl-carrier protein] synthase [Paenibacillus kribbensis]MEC0235138.1 citrate lyase holo-[acyl-carrier protein] synthase [Paenibacillus kribbensis]
MDSYEVTLEEMLQARENRADRQRQLISRYAVPLISVTINIPGPQKSSPTSKYVFQEGYRILMSQLAVNQMTPLHSEAYDLLTGPEAYVAVQADARILKKWAIAIEDGHPLGRLLDLDVIGLHGRAISRDELGLDKRKCLMCEQAAHSCGRSRAHALPELLEAVKALVDSYIRESIK